MARKVKTWPPKKHSPASNGHPRCDHCGAVLVKEKSGEKNREQDDVGEECGA